MKEIKLRVNNIINRRLMCAILAEAGYTVTVQEEKLYNRYLSSDFFIVIVDEPILPIYVSKDE